MSFINIRSYVHLHHQKHVDMKNKQTTNVFFTSRKGKASRCVTFVSIERSEQQKKDVCVIKRKKERKNKRKSQINSSEETLDKKNQSDKVCEGLNASADFHHRLSFTNDAFTTMFREGGLMKRNGGSKAKILWLTFARDSRPPRELRCRWISFAAAS